MSSAKIAQTKMVTKNGKTFPQVFWVAPENASAGAVNRSLGLQPQVTVDELGVNNAAMAALERAGERGTLGAPEDFVNGFEAAYEMGAEDPEAALIQYLSDNDPDEVTKNAYLNGFRAGVVAKLGKDESNHLTKSGTYYFHTDEQEAAAKEALSSKVFTHNPFKRGDEVVIPKGTPYTSTSPSVIGVQYTKQRHTSYKVEISSEGHSDASVGKMTVITPQIRTVGAGSHWKDFTVTPDVVRANGLEANATTLGDYAEDFARGYIY